MSMLDGLSRNPVPRGRGSIELRGDSAVAIGLSPDVAAQRSMQVRTDAAPAFDRCRLGSSSISRLQLGAFEAVLPDTNIATGLEWLTVIVQSRGSMRFENGDHAGTSTPGYIVILDSNVETAIGSDGRSARIVASVPKSALPAPVFRRIDRIRRIIEPAPGLPRIFAQFVRAICRDAIALSPAERTRLDRTLLQGVADLIETCGEPLHAIEATSLARTRAAALHLIDTDINGLVSTADLAQRLGCSERTLFLAFRDADTSPGRYIQRTRLERARVAIEASREVSITEIAYASGFQSYSHFSRCFRQTFGLTPRALRSHR